MGDGLYTEKYFGEHIGRTVGVVCSGDERQEGCHLPRVGVFGGVDFSDRHTPPYGKARNCVPYYCSNE